MIFITADNHFGHKNIIKYANRPFKTVEEMDRVMIENWNKVVGEDDIIYHLGDFALAPSSYIKEILDNLNGYKILIMGNHDRGINRMKRLGFDEVYKGIIKTPRIMSHYPIELSKYPQLNVGVDVWGYTPIPLPSSTNVIYCAHVHDRWLIKGGNDEIL